jgi:hypothetical protein
LIYFLDIFSFNVVVVVVVVAAVVVVVVKNVKRAYTTT